MHNRVREYRLKRCMTQQELANAVGVDRRTIFNMETRPKYQPGLVLAQRLADVLDTRLDKLFEVEAEAPHSNGRAAAPRTKETARQSR